MKTKQRASDQIELTLAITPRPRRRMPAQPFQRRRDRAGWWFREMHRAVDEVLGTAGRATESCEQTGLKLLMEA